ncbi:EXS family-domain-containing protein [Polychytrium aggregatum]|uniref:EXS family-domain-containing protein n=1 Tax=Polychytrium aggregatum TaxID=110093 RepID=UPI0022FF09AB|nr:EXS family-domain-containing protein [Polychytrium aggregatum]KAI9202654.1 EXS family-domain-containing protein [Polychytrium aggregatum]
MWKRSKILNVLLLLAVSFACYLILKNIYYAAAGLAGLPPLLHILLLLNIGLWCWASNLDILSRFGIDTLYILHVDTPASLSVFQSVQHYQQHQVDQMAHPPLGSARSSSLDLRSSIDIRDLGTAPSSAPKINLAAFTKSGSPGGSSIVTMPSSNKSSEGSSIALAPADSPVSSSHHNVYSLASCFTVIFVAALFGHGLVSWIWKDDRSILFPIAALGISFLLAAIPAISLFAEERIKFWNSMKRIVFGGIFSAVPFCDVILADILTSYARVFGDLHLALIELWWTEESELGASTSSELPGLSLSDWIGPVIISLPYLFRLRQCVAEFCLATDRGSRGRHLLNSLKYLSSIPVIAASFSMAWIRLKSYSDIDDAATLVEIESNMKFTVTIWVFFNMINTIFSIYWDIFVDWQLGGTSNAINASMHNSNSGSFLSRLKKELASLLLRPVLHFPSAMPYYFAMAFDVIVRFSWCLKVDLMYTLMTMTVKEWQTRQLGDEHEQIAGQTLAILEEAVVLELLIKLFEIVRRWVWVFFRIEREWVMRGLSQAGVFKERGNFSTKLYA